MRMTLAVLLCALSTAARADDWPQWLGPHRDGVWRETGLPDKFPDGGPKVLWRQPCGGGYSGPSVADGKVYVTDLVPAAGNSIPEGGFAKGRLTGQERLVCRDAKSGKELWSDAYDVTYAISYAAGPRCSPTVDAGRVFTLGAMGDLKAYDTGGKPLWSKNFLKDYGANVPVWGFAGHPLVDGEKLICVAGGSDGRLVVAFDKATGKEIWAAESCPGDFGYGSPVIFEFGGKRHLVVWHTKAVVGLDPATGKRLWHVPFDVRYALTAPTPVKVGTDGLFVTSFYNGSLFLKVGAESAEVVWKSKARGERAEQTTDLSSIMPIPVVVGDHIYGVCSYGQLRCLEAKTGKRVWETMQATRGKLTPARVAAEPTPGPGERWSNAFLTPTADGRFVLFNEQGDLILAKLSPAGYEEVSRAHVIDPTNPMAGKPRLVVWTHPAYAGGKVFVRNDKEVVCLEMGK